MTLDGLKVRLLHLRAWVHVVEVRLGLWLLPYRVWKRLLIGRVPRRDGAPAASEQERKRVATLCSAVERASRFSPRSRTCLVQGIATQRMLARAGFPARVHIGVARTEAGAFAAHAWVECEGEIVCGGLENESSPPRFTRLTVLPHER